MTTRIRRWIETDTGHRVPNHKSKCCHLHGHRYRWEAEIEGDVVDVEGVSDEGMLIDFSDVSAILKEHVHDVVCLLYTSPSPRDLSTSRMPSSA